MKKYLKYICFIMSLFMLLSVFTGCNVQEQIENVGDVIMQEYPVTIKDVTVTQKPKKVVVLTDELADAVIASGFETSLVAAADDCDQNNFKTLTKVDPADTDSIIALAPDLIISDVYTEEQLSAFNSAGIPCVTIDLASNREDFERMYKEIGSVLGGAHTGMETALNNAQSVFRTLDDLQRIIPETMIVKTACYIFDIEGSGVTGDMLAGTVMSYAGLTNVFAGSENGVYDIEDLKIVDPQYIFCPVDFMDNIMRNRELKELTAVKNGNVFEVEEKLARRNGRSIISFATTIAGIVYPELLEESTTVSTAMDPDEIADDKNEVLYKLGDSGDDIESFQKRLSQLGYYKGEITRVFDTATQEAIIYFQEVHKVEVTGVMDELTLEMLSGENVKEAPDKENDPQDLENPVGDLPVVDAEPEE